MTYRNNKETKIVDGIELEYDDWEEVINWYSLKARRGKHWGSTAYNMDGGEPDDRTAHKNCAECQELLDLAIKKAIE